MLIKNIPSLIQAAMNLAIGVFFVEDTIRLSLIAIFTEEPNSFDMIHIYYEADKSLAGKMRFKSLTYNFDNQEVLSQGLESIIKNSPVPIHKFKGQLQFSELINETTSYLTTTERNLILIHIARLAGYLQNQQQGLFSNHTDYIKHFNKFFQMIALYIGSATQEMNEDE